MKFLFTLTLCLVFIPTAPAYEPTLADQIALKIKQPGFSGNTANSIAYIAQTFHIPILAEIEGQSNLSTTIPSGDLSAADAIMLVAQQSKQRWEKVADAIHIYSPTTVDSKRNALRYKLQSFKVSPLPSDFTYDIEHRIDAAAEEAEHPSAVRGMVASGVLQVDFDQSGNRCTVETFHDMSGRDIILKELAPAHLAVIIVFPKTDKNSVPWTWKDVAANWFWIPVDKPYSHPFF